MESGSQRMMHTTQNIAWGAINRFLRLLGPFLIRTVIIYELGINYLGLDGLFVSILQVLNMTELGVSSAIIFSMYKPISENDSQFISQLLCFYKRIYHLVGGAILILGVSVLPFLSRLITGDIPNAINIYILYSMYLGNAVIGYFLYSYRRSLLIAHQRNDILSKIDTLVCVFQYLLQIAVLVILQDYYLFVFISILSTIANNAMSAYITKKYYPQYICQRHVDKMDKKVLSNIRKRVMGLMIYRICYTSRNSFDCIFISMYIGLSAVALYNNYFLVISAVISIMAIFPSSAEASIGNSIAVEQVSKNYRDFAILDYLYMTLAGGCTIGMVCLFQPFMIWWLGSDYLLSIDVVIAICLYFYTLKMGDIRALYNDAAGLWWEQRYRTIVEALSNILLNWVLIQYLGILGVILASMISVILFGFTFSSWITFKEYFGLSRLRNFYKSQGIYAMNTLFLGMAAYWICSLFVFQSSIIELLCRGIICFVIITAGYLLIYHKTKIFKESMNFLQCIRYSKGKQ